MPDVSVIIPNYNHAAYLKQRIQSVLDQTYQDFELIIIDDYSTDNSREIINEYKQHPRVSNIVFNTANGGGAFAQWKKGIEMARGKYIWIAESDDWCEPTLLETLVQAFEDNNNCVLAYVQTHTVNGDNVIHKTSAHNKMAEYVDGPAYIYQYLVGSCSIWNASMMLFKKECYANVSQRFTTFKMCGDWLFYIGLAKQGDVFISGKVLNYFRKHDKDISGNMYSSGKNYIEEIQILQELRTQSLISTEVFKQHLLDMYIKFLVFRYQFAADVNTAIASAFLGIDNGGYKNFLNISARLALLKIRVRRRVNLILK